MRYRMSVIYGHPVIAATRALRFADHVTKRNGGSGDENEEDSATENENRKINEHPKFSLDADFVWILQKRNSFKYGYGMLNAHIANEMIFLHRTFLFCIAKNNEKIKK